MLSCLSRPRLGCVTTSIVRRHTKRSFSTKSLSSNSRIYIATAGLISVPSLWWLTATRDDVPRLEGPPAEQLVPEPGLSKEDITQILSKEAYSFQVRNITGVDRYDGSQLASNSPCEDRFIHGKLSSPWNEADQWMSWAVFDGHSGWQTADLLTKQLLPFVQRRLTEAKPPSNEPVPNESVRRAIMNGFVDLDDSIIKTAQDTSNSKKSFQDKVKKLAPAFAGSCALLALYDPFTSTLHVACTGDSRAVLGQKGPDGKWEVIPLSVDQTGSNEEEVARISEEHPGEENIAKGGRVLGLMVSRAFGDSLWKWPLDFQKEMKQKFNGPAPLTPRYDVRTPPYLTAEPVVTSTKIDPNKPSFLILGTDGLWDYLSNKQGVDLVGNWLEQQGNGEKKSESEPADRQFDFGRFWKDVNWKFVEERTTIQDDNAAVHLMRNSLGGNYHELIAGRLAFGPPFSRRVRDDITVQVVFFNVEK
ncbi:Protein phosphatase 2C [Penicillium vulpinum]|uniref:Protein phosphatase 2C n=1 Tax=Penicillium vulpinum TaxID=29845 RepID=UPI002549B2C8|nr:Protein phosphatase 2C [Penicillium vulpinum]KAJ5950728.1 Protein phosphatase 2C [Penicillium vulpinum]